MTDKEIDAMEAGRDLDALIAETIFGLETRHDPDPGFEHFRQYLVGHLPDGQEVWDTVPSYSCKESVTETWQVVEKIKTRGLSWWMTDCSDGTIQAAIRRTPMTDTFAHATGGSIPEAVCKAALKAVNKQ